MTEIFHVFVQIDPPKGRFEGRVAQGAYIIENGEVVLVDPHGKAALDDSGNKYSHKLTEGDNPKQIAGRLTKELRKALRGNNAPREFSGPINYPKTGWM